MGPDRESEVWPTGADYVVEICQRLVKHLPIMDRMTVQHTLCCKRVCTGSRVTIDRLAGRVQFMRRQHPARPEVDLVLRLHSINSTQRKDHQYVPANPHQHPNLT